MTAEPHDLVLATKAAFDATAATMTIPTDGRPRIQDRVARRARRRTLRRGGALVMVVLVALASIVMVRTDRGADDAAVVAGPSTTTSTVPIADPRALAPADLDWYVTSYVPDRPVEGSAFEPAERYALSFAADQMIWTVSGELRQNYEAIAPMAGDRGETVVTPDGVTVVLYYADFGTDHVEVAWLDSPTAGPTKLVATPDAANGDEWPYPLWANRDQVLTMVARLQPVDPTTWTAALNPPPGVPDPASGATARPLHLGIDDDPIQTSLTLEPWWGFEASVVDEEGRAVHLMVGATPDGFLTGEGNETVELRGTQATVVTTSLEGRVYAAIPRTVDGSAPSAPPDPDGLTWTESGSTVTLYFGDVMTLDQAIDMANRLIVLDDDRWTALLQPID